MLTSDVKDKNSQPPNLDIFLALPDYLYLPLWFVALEKAQGAPREELCNSSRKVCEDGAQHT